MDNELKLVKLAAFFDELNKMEELSKEAAPVPRPKNPPRLGLGRGPRNGTGQGPRDGSGPRCSGEAPAGVGRGQGGPGRGRNRKMSSAKALSMANRLRRL